MHGQIANELSMILGNVQEEVRGIVSASQYVERMDMKPGKFPTTPGVYIIVNVVNGFYYVGGTVSLRGRRSSYATRIKSCNVHGDLGSAINEHGPENFYMCVVEFDLEETVFSDVENAYLSLLQPVDDPKGYNHNRISHNYAQIGGRVDEMHVFNGALMTIREISNLTGITRGTIRYRARNGLKIDKPTPRQRYAESRQ